MFGFNPLYAACLLAVGGNSPAFALDFIAGGLNQSVVTYSRASNATQFDSTGRLVWAPHNLCTRGGDQTAWSIGTDGNAAAYGVGPTGQTSYLSTWTVPSPGAGTVLVSQPSVSGARATFSIYLRYYNHQWVRMYLYQSSVASNGSVAYIDLVNKQLGTVGNAGTATGTTATLELLPNNWVRVVLSGNVPAANSSDWALLYATATGNGLSTRVGNGAAIEASSAILEVNSVASPQDWQPPFATAGSAYYGPRLDYSPSTLSARGLLVEEQRANLAVRSYAGSVNRTDVGAVSVQNTSTRGFGELVSSTADGLLGQHYTFGDAISSVIDNTQYTVSAIVVSSTNDLIQLSPSSTWADAGNAYVNFRFSTGTIVQAGSLVTGSSVQDLGSGAYRVSFTFLSRATGSVVGAACIFGHITAITDGRLASTTGNSVIVAGAIQVEQAAFVTSYIPTFGAAATRATEFATVTGVPYTVDGMTAIATGTLPAPLGGSLRRLMTMHGGAQAVDDVELASSSPASLAQMVTRSASVATFDPNASITTVPPFGRIRIAGRWSATDRAVAGNGSAVAANAIDPPLLNLTTLQIGANGSTCFNGWVESIQIHTRLFSNAELTSASAL